MLFGLIAGVARVAREPSPPRPQGPVYVAERNEAEGNTQVEPDSFAWGKKVVATFQAWRNFDGGAVALGWAASADAGTHWRSGKLPLGDYFAASDPVVAFDAAHHVWLIAGIGFRGHLRRALTGWDQVDGTGCRRRRCRRGPRQGVDHVRQRRALAVPRPLLPRVRRHRALAARHPDK